MNFDKKGNNEDWNGLYSEDIFLKELIFHEIDPESIKEVTLEINYKHRKILNSNSYKENLIKTYNKIFE